MKYCIKCGQALEDRDLFCSRCGARVPDILEEAGQAFYHGDQTAFERIYRNTEGWVRGFVHRRVREAEVDDCMQTIYVKVYEKIGDFSGEEGKFRGWFSSIVHTTAIDYARRYGSREEHEAALYQGDPDDEYELQIPDKNPIPEEVMEQEETARIFREILDGMSQEQCICLMLYYYEGKKQTDIASELGVSENTVKSRLRLGRQHVKESVLQLEKQGTKLYGAAPIPFFVYLLRYMENAVETGSGGGFASQKLWSGIVSSIQNIHSGAAAAAVGAAGRAAGKAVLTKILIGILSAGVLGGAVFGGYKAAQKMRDRTGNEPEIEEPVIAEDNGEPSETVPVEENDRPSESVPEEEITEETAALPGMPEMSVPNTGEGSWYKYIQINEDGTFSGQTQDTNMGDGEVLDSTYFGEFSDIEKVDEYTYLAAVSSIQYEHEPGTEDNESLEGMTIVYTTAEMDEGDVFLFYLPGKPLSEIDNPDVTDIIEWMFPDDMQDGILDRYVMAPANGEGECYFSGPAD